MTRDAAIAAARSYLTSGAFEEDLARRVAVPTESQTPEGLPHTRRYLEDEMMPAFEAMGFTGTIFENPRPGVGPVLLATRDEGADVTVLGYGHGDVIRGQTDQWTKGAGPWQTARDGERQRRRLLLRHEPQRPARQLPSAPWRVPAYPPCGLPGASWHSCHNPAGQPAHHAGSGSA